MSNLSVIVAFFAFFGFMGAILDKLLKKHQKEKLHQTMYHWWLRLDQTPVRNLYKLMAEYTLTAFGKVFRWPFWSWKNWLLLIVISWLLTSVASVSGYYLSPGAINSLFLPLPAFTTYFANFLFDWLTIVITLRLLSVIQILNPLIGLTVIAIDMVIACILVVICYGVVWWASGIAFEHGWWGADNKQAIIKQYFVKNHKEVLVNDGFTEKATVKFNHELSVYDYIVHGSPGYKYIISGNDHSFDTIVRFEVTEEKLARNYKIAHKFTNDWFTLLTPLTTFIPTVLYMILLIILLLGKIIIEITMYLLDVMTQDDPVKDAKSFMPGTLIGLLCGLVAALLKIVVELVKSSPSGLSR